MSRSGDQRIEIGAVDPFMAGARIYLYFLSHLKGERLPGEPGESGTFMKPFGAFKRLNYAL